MPLSCRLIILTLSLAVVPLETKSMLCVTSVQGYTAGLAVILSLCTVVEMSMVWISMRGTVIHTEPRACMPYFVCGRLGKRLLSVGLKPKPISSYIHCLYCAHSNVCTEWYCSSNIMNIVQNRNVMLWKHSKHCWNILVL